MKKKSVLVFPVLFFLVMFLIVGCTPTPTPTPTPKPTNPVEPPSIYSVQYSSPCVQVGTQITIYGENFGPSKGNNTVIMNGVVAEVSFWSDSQIIAVVPSPSFWGNALRIAVTVGGVPTDEHWIYNICPGPIPTPIPTPTMTPPPIPPRVDIARNIAITKANNEGNNVPVGVPWMKEIVPGGIGSTHVRYTYYGAGDWFIDITYPTVAEPDFSVVISFEGFTIWTGTVFYGETELLFYPY